MSNQFTKNGQDVFIEDGFLVRGNLKVCMQDVYNYYITENHSRKETEAYFNLTGRMFEKIRDFLQIKKSRQLSNVHNKKTCLERYGDPTYNNIEQNKKTCLEKYGVENVYQADTVKKKCEQTKLEKYGDAHFINQDKIRQTNLERYGVSMPLQNSICREKAKQTCFEHYGVEYPMQSEEVRAKYNFTELSEKAFETKKQHSTTNTSKIQT